MTPATVNRVRLVCELISIAIPLAVGSILVSGGGWATPFRTTTIMCFSVPAGVAINLTWRLLASRRRRQT